MKANRVDASGFTSLFAAFRRPLKAEKRLLALLLMLCVVVGSPTAIGQEQAENPVPGPNDRIIQFNFASTPWETVLDRFAQVSGLVLQMDVRPEGTFNYVRDPTRYTVSEAIDVLNTSLIPKGNYLLRDGRFLKVINLAEGGVPQSQIPHVQPGELDRRGDSEFVRVMFPLVSVTAEQAEKDLENLVGPYGKIAGLGSINRLMVIDTAGQAKVIQDAIAQIDSEQDSLRLRSTFQLHRASAATVRDTIEQLYGMSPKQGGGTSTIKGKDDLPASQQFQLAVNERSNALIVQAPPQMMQELSKLIARLDADKAPVVNDVRIFRLRNAQAAEVAELLKKTLYGSDKTPESGAASGAEIPATDASISGRSAVLRFSPKTNNADDAVTIESGILDEVQITPQVRTNSVVVSAPLSSMELIASLIQEMDQPPTIEAVTKVFFLKNADATNMRLTLRELFDIESDEPALAATGLNPSADSSLRQASFERPIAVAPGDNPPVSIRIAVNARTNSLIVSGPESAATMVEAVIMKLDSNDLSARENRVVRLMNARGTDVAEALTSFYAQKRKIELPSAQSGGAGEQSLIGAYQSLEQEVVAVPLQDVTSGTGLPVNNMILVSASPRYFREVMDLIQEMDAVQAQVHIQVVIAQLNLRDDFEFGIEWGLQDPALFDRSQVTVINDTANGPFIDGQGFQFQSAGNGALGALPNSSSDQSIATRSIEAGQALTNFVVGRSSTVTELGGASGLLLSASSDSLAAMMRALEGQGYLEVISRPQIMTLDGTAANILVGEQFPFVGSFNSTQTSTSSPVEFADIGIHLRVIPTISPDGRILMRVSPTVSELRELVNVQVVSTAQGLVGQQAPRIDTIQADTVVNVIDGQTVVIGGLIQHRTRTNERKIPWLGNLPLVGHLFGFTQESDSKRELLIVLTPTVIRGPEEMEQIKQVELDRSCWILNHASKEHGNIDQFDPYGTQYIRGTMPGIVETVVTEHPPVLVEQSLEQPENVPLPVPSSGVGTYDDELPDFER